MSKTKKVTKASKTKRAFSGSKKSSGAKTKISAYGVPTALNETLQINTYLSKMASKFRTSSLINTLKNIKGNVDSRIDVDHKTEFYLFTALLALCVMTLFFK